MLRVKGGRDIATRHAASTAVQGQAGDAMPSPMVTKATGTIGIKREYNAPRALIVARNRPAQLPTRPPTGMNTERINTENIQLAFHGHPTCMTRAASATIIQGNSAQPILTAVGRQLVQQRILTPQHPTTTCVRIRCLRLGHQPLHQPHGDVHQPHHQPTNQARGQKDNGSTLAVPESPLGHQPTHQAVLL